MKINLVAGARPNFMKIAPIIRELEEMSKGQQANNLSWKLVHTGQHYDYEMSRIFFEELDISEPDYFLNAGSGSHAEQSAKAMLEFEKVCLYEKPDVVVVVGDVNSTLACSITAKKMHIKIAHVEAGLRSGDLSMPEEINRIVTDSISDYLFVTEKTGVENLKKEGRKEEHIFFVGNIMIDTLYYGLKRIEDRKFGRSAVSKASINSGYHLTNPSPETNDYAVVTLHRPSNVDNKAKLKNILGVLKEISNDMVIYFPIHPRTKTNIENYGYDYLIKNSNIKILPPLSYLEFLSLWKEASLVLTDSGGLQEETTALGIPCFTLRENTERPVTVESGTNILVGTVADNILDAYKEFKGGVRKKGKIPELWDGKTANRVLTILCESDLN